jgi:hypothetical protein
MHHSSALSVDPNQFFILVPTAFHTFGPAAGLIADDYASLPNTRAKIVSTCLKW